MHGLKKMFGLKLAEVLPKIKFEKDNISDACLLGKQTWPSLKVKDIMSTSNTTTNYPYIFM